MATRLTPPVSERDHIFGALNAPIEFVEYGDYQCQHCSVVHPVVKALEQSYGKDLKFVFRHFPQLQAHPYAEPAALAAETAGRQGAFWQMHDMIYARQLQLNIEAIFDFAEELALNMMKFEKDIRDKAILAKVEADFMSGMRSGVNGTPTFFINAYKYNGVHDFDSMATAIELSIIERQHR